MFGSREEEALRDAVNYLAEEGEEVRMSEAGNEVGKIIDDDEGVVGKPFAVELTKSSPTVGLIFQRLSASGCVVADDVSDHRGVTLRE